MLFASIGIAVGFAIVICGYVLMTKFYFTLSGIVLILLGCILGNCCGDAIHYMMGGGFVVWARVYRVSRRVITTVSGKQFSEYLYFSVCYYKGCTETCVVKEHKVGALSAKDIDSWRLVSVGKNGNSFLSKLRFKRPIGMRHSREDIITSECGRRGVI